MAEEKWRRRGTFATSVTIRQTGGVTTNPDISGFINQGGTLMLSASSGTVQGGTAKLLDLSYSRFRLPLNAGSVGTATVGLGALVGGSAGAVKLGAGGGSGMIGLNIGGTIYTIQFPQAGGSVHVIANAAGA